MMATEDVEGEARMSERWYSVEEIAAHLGIGRETVYRWIDHKGLPAHRIGRFWKFKVSEVDEWARTGGAADGPAGATNESGEGQ